MHRLRLEAHHLDPRHGPRHVQLQRRLLSPGVPLASRYCRQRTDHRPLRKVCLRDDAVGLPRPAALGASQTAASFSKPWRLPRPHMHD